MKILQKLSRRLRGADRNVNTGRNEPCWCGSGKKYKRCCLDSDRNYLQGQSRSCTTS